MCMPLQCHLARCYTDLAVTELRTIINWHIGIGIRANASSF